MKEIRETKNSIIDILFRECVSRVSDGKTMCNYLMDGRCQYGNCNQKCTPAIQWFEISKEVLPKLEALMEKQPTTNPCELVENPFGEPQEHGMTPKSLLFDVTRCGIISGNTEELLLWAKYVWEVSSQAQLEACLPYMQG